MRQLGARHRKRKDNCSHKVGPDRLKQNQVVRSRKARKVKAHRGCRPRRTDQQKQLLSPRSEVLLALVVREIGLTREALATAAARERVERCADVVAVRVEFVQRDAPPHGARAGVLAGEAQQDRFRDRPLRGVEAVVGALGQTSDRAAHAARALVGDEAQVTPVALLPELEQRAREQRQRTRLVRGVGQQPLDQGALDAQPARWAGSSIARRSSSRCIGPTRTWFAPSSVASSGYAAQRP